MSTPLRVLIVDDSEDDAALLLQELRRGAYDPVSERVDTPEAMTAALDGQTWDVVLCDYVMPHFSGPAALALMRERGLDLPFIIVSGKVGEETAVAAVKAGAHDYIMKGNLARLVPAIDREIREAGERRELRWAEEALRESEYKYRSLFENMASGFAYCKIILDRNNRPVDFVYLEVNDSFERLTGLKKKDTVGKKATEAIPGIKDSHPELFDIYGKVALTGEETKFDIYFEPLEIWLSISAYSTRENYFVAVFEDITERRRTEEALKQAHEELQQTHENLKRAQASAIASEKLAALGRLTAGVSHEILNPLNVINMNLYMMLNDPNVHPETASDLQNLREQSNRIAKICEDLLYFARQRPPERRELNINETVRRTLGLLEREFRLQNVAVELKLAEELPKILADQDQLQQVVLNLLTNASGAMPEGGRLVLSTSEVQPLFLGEKNFVELRVEDTGPGIPADHMDKLFEPFFTTKPEGEGTGLGLSICQGIVESHGGSIWVENVPGGGAAFVVRLGAESK